MLELKFKQFVLIFDFSFFAVVSLMLLFSNSKYVITCLVACIWHETGHLISMLIEKVKVEKIFFYAGGIRITPDQLFELMSCRVRLVVLLSGSMLNFITFVLLKDSNYEVIAVFASINAIIGAFNLLPLQFLDGGKILVLILRRLCCYQRAVFLERYMKHINIILIIIVILFLLITGKRNVTLLVTSCCLLFSAFIDS